MKIDYPTWLKKHKERQNEKTTLKTNLQMWPFEVIQRTITNTTLCILSMHPAMKPGDIIRISSQLLLNVFIRT